MSDPIDDDQDDEIAPVSVALDLMVWAEVCAALQLFVKHESTRECPASRRDALFALREIDRVVMGKSEQAPPDDVLGPEAPAPAAPSRDDWLAAYAERFAEQDDRIGRLQHAIGQAIDEIDAGKPVDARAVLADAIEVES